MRLFVQCTRVISVAGWCHQAEIVAPVTGFADKGGEASTKNADGRARCRKVRDDDPRW
ncbi:hypothetical protein RJJ37_21000 [Rhizobium redzepovicii]|uniref:Uncharacterized protein n=1 Tax=Rhizobium redzepovicii TaxID=2867518 RepID=A0AAW8P4U6_9HYPH|nr:MULTISPECIES: hypothetical protein [Rhizobium]MBB3525637.1 hypothetical protein [Rhizobium sp. BK456]MBY4591063.1 hypothetical protein [Rhizobium redzepovicii]MBY4615268.1 hypothetical protein [Rhizobium redzepovicii]MDF0661992.1 hypothetical protein [Rhizobium sp. BC49]MDR9762087.1 hypothetical protein [Rhizobium redzepovicii]